MEPKFRIVNTTIKPVVRDNRGVDIRKAVEKVGHAVKFKEGKNDIVLHAGQVRLVSEVNPGVMSLQRGGFVRIEVVKDMTEALKDHVLSAETNKVEDTPLKVKAVEMGHDDYSQKSGSEMEGAINPDGNPNFVVKAKRTNKKYATVTDSGEKDGEGAEVSPSLS